MQHRDRTGIINESLAKQREDTSVGLNTAEQRERNSQREMEEEGSLEPNVSFLSACKVF